MNRSHGRRIGKVQRLRQWLAHSGQPDHLLREACFYTDSINDLALLSAVRQPVVVDPDPRLESAALRNRWKMLRLNRARQLNCGADDNRKRGDSPP